MYQRRITHLCHERVAAAAIAYRAGDLRTAYTRLEEAHVLGQPYLETHVIVHLWLLRVGVRRRDVREVIGQLARLVLVPFGHLTGRLPAGNTGGSNVSAFQPMPIPADLQLLLHPMPTEMESDRTGSAWSRGWRWWLLGLAVAGLDLAVKSFIQANLAYGASIPVTSFFNIVHVWNTGAAFSFLADAGGWQRYFLIAIALGAAVFLTWFLTKPHRTLEALAYSLILGGALGNAIDRIARGYVVDYLDFFWSRWHWPSFNIADIAICSAAALLIWLAWKERNHSTEVAHEAKG